jgi:hypothetical protein
MVLELFIDVPSSGMISQVEESLISVVDDDDKEIKIKVKLYMHNI